MKYKSVLYGVICVLILVATATGIFYQTPGSTFTFTTIRGETAIFQGSGLYHYDPAWFAFTGMVWDVINLFIGLPLLVMAIYLSHRNSLRGRLLLSGLLFYFFYVYLGAMVSYAFNFLFLVYTLIFALCGVAFFLNLGGIDIKRLPEQLSERFPRRVFIGFTFIVGATLTILWVGRSMSVVINGQFPPDASGVSSLQIDGLDLGIVVPLMFSTGILLWRRSPLGYLLTSVSLGYGLLMSISLPAFAIAPLIHEGKTNPIEAIPFLLLSLAGLVLVGLYYLNVRDAELTPTQILAQPVHGASRL